MLAFSDIAVSFLLTCIIFKSYWNTYIFVEMLTSYVKNDISVLM